jgi:DNA segregation ATPase FtsK/SpoIIIE-like protein
MNDEQLYQKALDFVRSERMASYQFLQRRLKVDFGKAHSIMKRLEAEGIIEVESLPTGFVVRVLNVA